MKTQLKQLRKMAHLTQSELAELISQTPRVVGAWERDETELPLEDAIVICDVLSEAIGRHITLDELAGRWSYVDESVVSQYTSQLSPAERELLDSYRASDERGQGNILDMAGREKGRRR